MTKIKKLSQDIESANDAMRTYLTKKFPIGTRVSCYLMHGQQNPSKGEVIRIEGGQYAYLRVRLDSRTNAVRSVPANEVTVLERV